MNIDLENNFGKNAALDSDSDQKPNWKIIGSVITVLLLAVAGFGYRDFTVNRSGLSGDRSLLPVCSPPSHSSFFGGIEFSD